MEQSNAFSVDYLTNATEMDTLMRVHESFDLVAREIKSAGKRVRLYFVDGFIKDVVMVNIMTELLKMQPAQYETLETTRDFADSFLAYVETDVCASKDEFMKSVFSGMVGVLVEGFPDAVLLDVRTYPARSVDEPENDKVLRGPHEGFVETLIFNTALVRRRIRDANLTMTIHQIGTQSKTDVALCYMNGRAEGKLVQAVQKKLSDIQINSLSMAQESLAELIVPKQWYNPFPVIRYSERPDSVAACLYEGSLVLMVDNSPAVMILPTGFWDFLQDTNDFVFPPMIGTFFRLLRAMVFLLSVFLTPVWYLLIEYQQLLPSWMEFLKIKGEYALPLVAQFLIIEFMLDALKIASLNTPTALSNSFSVVGALVLGEFAIKAGWFNSEVVLYMAFVAIASFAQPSVELGYAFKFERMLLVILTAALDVWGFLAGALVMLLIFVTTKTVTGRCYLFPLIPFNGKQLLRRLVRLPIRPDNC